MSRLAPVLAFSLASFSTLLGIVPKVVRRRLLRAAGATAGMDRVHEDVTVETMCGFGNVVTMLGLARDEMRSLQRALRRAVSRRARALRRPAGRPVRRQGPLVDRAREAGVCDSRRDGHAARVRDAPDARRRVVATVAELVGYVSSPRSMPLRWDAGGPHRRVAPSTEDRRDGACCPRRRGVKLRLIAAISGSQGRLQRLLQHRPVVFAGEDAVAQVALEQDQP